MANFINAIPKKRESRIAWQKADGKDKHFSISIVSM